MLRHVRSAAQRVGLIVIPGCLSLCLSGCRSAPTWSRRGSGSRQTLLLLQFLSEFANIWAQYSPWTYASTHVGFFDLCPNVQMAALRTWRIVPHMACLSVCHAHITRKPHDRSSPNFCACCPWLGRGLVLLWRRCDVIHFRFLLIDRDRKCSLRLAYRGRSLLSAIALLFFYLLKFFNFWRFIGVIINYTMSCSHVAIFTGFWPEPLEKLQQIAKAKLTTTHITAEHESFNNIRQMASICTHLQGESKK